MIYSLCKWLANAVARLYFRFQAYHVERVPKVGGALLVSNHVSYLDPPLSGIAIRRKIYFLARNTLMKYRWSRWFFTKLNCIPVNRDQMELTSFRMVIQLLKKGEIVVLFPEGTRSVDGHLKEGKVGTGMIIKHAGVRVVPCYISGAAAAWPRLAQFPQPKKVRVIYGEPIDFSHFHGAGNKREVYGEITQEVMKAIARLKTELEQEIQGRAAAGQGAIPT